MSSIQNTQTLPVIYLNTTDRMIRFGMVVEGLIAEQDVALGVLASGTEAMVRGGAHPWDVALTTYFYDHFLYDRPGSVG